MPITLPYATGVLTSVLLGDTPVPFELAGTGQYKLQLPLDKLLAGQTKLTCTWTLVLPGLGDGQPKRAAQEPDPGHLL